MKLKLNFTFNELIHSSFVITFGGMSQKATNRGPVHYVYNDVMKFDLIEQVWERSGDRSATLADSPSVRFGHSAVMVGQTEMIVYAGRFNSLYGDVWSLNTSALDTTLFDPDKDKVSYADILYYVLAIFALVAVCSCVLIFVRGRPKISWCVLSAIHMPWIY